MVQQLQRPKSLQEVLQERQERQVLLVRQERQVLLGLLVRQERQGQRGLLVRQERQVLLGLLVRQERQVLLGLLVRQERQVRQVLQGSMLTARRSSLRNLQLAPISQFKFQAAIGSKWGNMSTSQVAAGIKSQAAASPLSTWTTSATAATFLLVPLLLHQKSLLMALLERQGLLDQQERLGLLVRQERQVLLGLLVRQERQVLLGLLVRQERQVRQVLQGSMLTARRSSLRNLQLAPISQFKFQAAIGSKWGNMST